MSDYAAREIQWAGGTHTFNLGDKRARFRMQVIGLPGIYGSNAAACLRRLEEGLYGPDDVERVLEWGLIGGGMPSREANQLIDQHVRTKPLAENAIIAVAVLSALFVKEEVSA